MFKALFLAILLAYAITNITADKKIVCYYGSWAHYRPGLGKFDATDINPALCTHMIYTFVGITTNGDIRILDEWLDLPSGLDGYGKFIGLRKSSPITKALIAIGGWNEGSINYSQVAANASLRARFIKSVVNFLWRYGFDGFDIDWEYPNQRGGNEADKVNFVSLLKEMKQEFDKHGYILTIAAGATESSASKSYIISEVSRYVDFINLMSYDMNGSWNSVTGINAPLYPSSSETGDQAELNVDAAVKYWLSEGAPANKIVVGIPSYGRSFTLANSLNNGVGAPATGPGSAGQYTREAGMLGYNEICQYVNQGWTVVRDPEQHVPYAFNGNQWVGYDDLRSIEEKANYVKSRGLGGMMMWSVETDDFQGTCGEKYPLLSTVNRVLRGFTPSTPTSPSVTNSPQTSIPTSPATSSTPSPDNSICKSEGFVRDPNNCSIFYFCKNVNNRYLIAKFQCPTGTAFNPSFNGCDYRNNVPGC